MLFVDEAVADELRDWCGESHVGGDAELSGGVAELEDVEGVVLELVDVERADVGLVEEDRPVSVGGAREHDGGGGGLHVDSRSSTLTPGKRLVKTSRSAGSTL